MDAAEGGLTGSVREGGGAVAARSCAGEEVGKSRYATTVDDVRNVLKW